jgi:hypothetical protein
MRRESVLITTLDLPKYRPVDARVTAAAWCCSAGAEPMSWHFHAYRWAQGLVA